jgi:hypothetical protein
LSAGLDPSIGVFITAFGGVAAAIGTFYAGHRRGSDRTKKEWEKRLEEERQRHEQPSFTDIALDLLPDYIKFIGGMRNDYQSRFMHSITPRDREFFRRVVLELEVDY